VLRVDPHQAKYFRALPLHRSQNEMVHDSFSLFHYDMRISPDLVQELLSYGPRVTVVSPPELCVMMRNELRQALLQYSTATSDESNSNKGENTTAD
jgi:predicted DNA-binding transcriptional regulator YafY